MKTVLAVIVVALLLGGVVAMIVLVLRHVRQLNKVYSQLAEAYRGTLYPGRFISDPEVHFDQDGTVIVNVGGSSIGPSATGSGVRASRWCCQVSAMHYDCEIWPEEANVWGEPNVEMGSPEFARKFWIRGVDAPKVLTAAVQQKIEKLRSCGSDRSSHGHCIIRMAKGYLVVTKSGGVAGVVNDFKTLYEITQCVLQLRDEIRRIEQ